MADFARLDEELDALGAGVDVEATLAAIPQSEGLVAADEALEALAKNVVLAKAPSGIAVKMSEATAPNAVAERDAEVAEPDAEEVVVEADANDGPDTSEAASTLSNFRAGLTPSDMAQLAEMEALELSAEGSTPLDPSSVSAEVVDVADSGDEPLRAAESIPPAPDLNTASAAPAPASSEASPPNEPPPPSEPRLPSEPPNTPPEPIFKEEDLAAIRASTPPSPGAEAQADVEVEVESLDELELDEIDFVEFEDDEMELTKGDSEVSADTEPAEVVAESETAMSEPEAVSDDGGQTVVDADDDPEQGEGEKKGFFKKIFG